MRTFNRILVDVDPHALHHPALDRAVAIAQATEAELVVTGVMTARDLPAWSSAQSDAVAIDQVKDLLRIVAAGVSNVKVSTKLLFGPQAAALVAEAKSSGADLLIRSHVRDIAQLSPPGGGVDRELIRTCPAPVLLVGSGAAAVRPRIVGAVAPDAGWGATTARLNRAIIDYALSMAGIGSGSTTLLQAFDSPALRLTHQEGADIAGYSEERRRKIVTELAGMVRDIGEDPHCVDLSVHAGSIDRVLPEFVVSQGIDLVVMGVTPRRGLARVMFGHSANRLLRRLPCSVLAVKLDQRYARRISEPSRK